VLTNDGVRQLLELAPHSEYVNIRSAGHMVAGDRNDTFRRAVVEFLTRTTPSGSLSPDARQRAALLKRLDDDPELNDIP